MNKTIYVTDLKVWGRLKATADRTNESMSTIIERALREYFNNDAAQKLEQIREILE